MKTPQTLGATLQNFDFRSNCREEFLYLCSIPQSYCTVSKLVGMAVSDFE